MEFIVVIKDEQNEISFDFQKIDQVLTFVKTIMEISDYTIEIITNMEA